MPDSSIAVRESLFVCPTHIQPIQPYREDSTHILHVVGAIPNEEPVLVITDGLLGRLLPIFFELAEKQRRKQLNDKPLSLMSISLDCQDQPRKMPASQNARSG